MMIDKVFGEMLNELMHPTDMSRMAYLALNWPRLTLYLLAFIFLVLPIRIAAAVIYLCFLEGKEAVRILLTGGTTW